MAAFQRDKIRDVYREKYPDIFGNNTSRVVAQESALDPPTDVTTRDLNYGLQIVRFIADEIADLKILMDTSRASEDDTRLMEEGLLPGPAQPISSRNLGQSGETRFVPTAYKMC